jgi:hypothetical protein
MLTHTSALFSSTGSEGSRLIVDASSQRFDLPGKLEQRRMFAVEGVSLRCQVGEGREGLGETGFEAVDVKSVQVAVMSDEILHSDCRPPLTST